MWRKEALPLPVYASSHPLGAAVFQGPYSGHGAQLTLGILVPCRQNRARLPRTPNAPRRKGVSSFVRKNKSDPGRRTSTRPPVGGAPRMNWMRAVSRLALGLIARQHRDRSGRSPDRHRAYHRHRHRPTAQMTPSPTSPLGSSALGSVGERAPTASYTMNNVPAGAHRYAPANRLHADRSTRHVRRRPDANVNFAHGRRLGDARPDGRRRIWHAAALRSDRPVATVTPNVEQTPVLSLEQTLRARRPASW